LAELGELRSKLQHGNTRIDSIEYLHLDFLASAGLGIELFDEFTGSLGDQWALLFDELELAPAEIREMLLGAFRSVDSRFLFKLSLSPFSEELRVLDGPSAPKVGEDYEFISLTYARRRGGRLFAEALFQAQLARRGIPAKSPEQLFGLSPFDSADEEHGSDKTISPSDENSHQPYGPGTELHKTFVRLRDTDPSFADYLESNKVDLDRLGELSESGRAAHLRKVRNLVVLREAFRTAEGNIRSRKTRALYSGASSLFAIVEGNPRLFISIIGRLLDEHPSGRRISREAQSEAVTRAAERFLSLLRAIPLGKSGVARYEGLRASQGVFSLIDTIGTRFFEWIVRWPFNPNVPCAFYVDKGVSDPIKEGVGQALNVGALVHIPEGPEEALLGDLTGQKFRLSYLLAPHYRLPLRLGRAVPLSSLLVDSHRAPDAPRQDVLFEEIEGEDRA
jgi:hypothetical protein